jgi:molecular chaperone HtpG
MRLAVTITGVAWAGAEIFQMGACAREKDEYFSRPLPNLPIMSSEHQSFQAEVRQLLDIVIHSLYTDREIFTRELVSNASDALEKLKLLQLTESAIYEPEQPLQIEITTDEENRQLVIADRGIGMTREELVQNLGTIAHSGTKAFLQSMKEKGTQNGGMIGQFGVGFYSVFMVADRVDVFTHSWRTEAPSLRWTSDGREGYEIEEVDSQARGARMVIHLKEEYAEYAKESRIKELLNKYSNFVAFPILLNGERVNQVEALWLKAKNEVSDKEYEDFYQFTAKAWDKPRFTMHFTADAPLDIHALLFLPEENQERFGFGPVQPGVALYCKRVLIDPQPEGLLPEWLRFVRGVIDSADLPLNISRESMQDSALVKKLGQVVTKRLLKFLEKKATDDAEAYRAFYQGFSRFIKEGIVSSHEHREALAGLLRFESSMTEGDSLSSFDDYIARMKDGQSDIYYLAGTSRAVMESGPYLEAFKARGLEVAYFTEGVDEFVFESLGTFREKKLVRADQADIELEETALDGEALATAEVEALQTWWQDAMGEQLKEVKTGKRLIASPVVALVPEDAPNPQMRAMMKAMGQEAPAVKPVLEINPRHALVKKLATLRTEKPELAGLVAQQLVDQAMLSAGLVEHPQQLATRMNEILEKIL